MPLMLCPFAGCPQSLLSHGRGVVRGSAPDDSRHRAGPEATAACATAVDWYRLRSPMGAVGQEVGAAPVQDDPLASKFVRGPWPGP
jgi:hypothetical protein